MEKISQFYQMQIIEKATFNRYIVEQPNTITVWLYTENIKHFKLEEKNIQFDLAEIQLISYNDLNPARVKIDLTRLLRKGIFTVGDLQNILP